MANTIDIDVGDSLLVGPRGPQGEIGPRGYGIKGIDKTGSNKLVDTYTVTFDDDRTATFEVTNGKGIASIDLTSTVENVDTYTITYNDETTSTFTVTNSNVSREEFEEAVEVINSEMNTKEAEGEKVKLTGVATTNLDITVQGNTYQETTTGKNVFNNSNLNENTIKGVTYTPVYKNNQLQYINVNGTATETSSYNIKKITLPSGAYKLNGCKGGSTSTYCLIVNLGSTTYDRIIQEDEEKTFSLDEEATMRESYIRVMSGVEMNNVKFYPMIREESIADDTYEPYTGGIASPNPDFPQEIQMVTGENEVQIQGKNLVNLEFKVDSPTIAGLDFAHTSSSFTLKGTTNTGTYKIFNLKNNLPIKSGKTYTFSANVSEINSGLFVAIRGFNSSSKELFKISINTTVTQKTTKTLIFDEELDHLTFIIENLKTNTYYDLSCELQLEEGSIATEYEPSVLSYYPLSLGSIELAGIGDYKDYIHKSGTDWFVHRAIGRVIFDGSENWEGQWSADLWAYKAFIDDMLKSTSNDDLPYLYSNLFASNTQNLLYRHGPYGICRRTNNAQVIIRNDYTTSLADFKTWLSTHNTTVYYPKATSTEEQITDTSLIQQLEALNQATAKGNNFIVTTETENLKPILKVQYKESTRYKANDLENRVEKLEEQIKHAGHVYGVRRKRENNSSSEWERTDDAIGLVANATHDGTEVQNDFDNLSPWKDIISFNLDLETGHKKAYYGDPDFAFDGSNGDVYTHIPDIYYRVWQDDEYDYVQIADFAETEFTKCDAFDIQRYKTGIVNNQLHSYSNIPASAYNNIVTYRTMARELGEDYCLLDWRYFIIQLLYLVEYADYNSQLKLGNGFTSMRHNQADVSLLAETNTHRFVVNTNAGDAFVVGQTVCVGTASEKYDIAESRKITAITDYNSDGITGKSIALDGAAFSTTITSVIWSSAQHSGQCDVLGMKSGCLASDSKHEVTYRGIEGLYGNINTCLDGINMRGRKAYISYEPTEYSSTIYETPYYALNYVCPNSNAMIKKLGFDINNPLIRIPIEVGGSSSTYIPDTLYQAGGDRIARIGGSLTEGNNAGIWCFLCNVSYTGVNWNTGARVIKYK